MNTHKLFSKAKLFYFLLLTMALMNNLSAVDLITREKAKAYFIASEQYLKKGDYSDAMESLEKAEELMGSSNSAFKALEVQIYFKRGWYKSAKSAVEEFYQLNPNEQLKRKVAPYLFEIDKAIAREEKEKEDALEKERQQQQQAESDRKEMPKMVDEFVARVREARSEALLKVIKESNRFGGHLRIDNLHLTCSFEIKDALVARIEDNVMNPVFMIDSEWSKWDKYWSVPKVISHDLKRQGNFAVTYQESFNSRAYSMKVIEVDYTLKSKDDFEKKVASGLEVAMKRTFKVFKVWVPFSDNLKPFYSRNSKAFEEAFYKKINSGGNVIISPKKGHIFGSGKPLF